MKQPVCYEELTKRYNCNNYTAQHCAYHWCNPLKNAEVLHA